ncbi:MAG: BrnT family toxin [Patescibacteria group bacterium]
MKILRGIIGFEWDAHNRDKNLTKHRVTDDECEEVFFDEKKKILKDLLHSGAEKRYVIVGNTKKGRVLFVAFTIRNNKIRVISARDLNKKECHLYEKES